MISKFLGNNDYDNQISEENKEGKAEDDNEITRKKEDKDNTYNCLTKLLKIIDVGLDKNYDSFIEDLKKIAKPLVAYNENGSSNQIKLKNLPITEYRSYKSPFMTLKQTSTVESEENNFFPKYQKNKFFFFEQYFRDFHDFYHTNFKYLDIDDQDDKKIDNKKLRFKIYKDFKIKVVLREEKKMLTSFIDQMYSIHQFLDTFNEKFPSGHQDYLTTIDYDFKKFWTGFVDSIDEIEVNFLLYVVPWCDLEQSKHHSDDLISNIPALLSEFLAGKDYIYLNLIYHPWLSYKSNEQHLDGIIEQNWSDLRDKTKSVIVTAE